MPSVGYIRRPRKDSKIYIYIRNVFWRGCKMLAPGQFWDKALAVYHSLHTRRHSPYSLTIRCQVACHNETLSLSLSTFKQAIRRHPIVERPKVVASHRLTSGLFSLMHPIQEHTQPKGLRTFFSSTRGVEGLFFLSQLRRNGTDTELTCVRRPLVPVINHRRPDSVEPYVLDPTLKFGDTNIYM